VITAGSTRPEPLPRGIEHRLEKFTELLATAIANAQAKSELSASRRRIVTASDAARRRIERDLHDGTQQRLLGIGLGLNAVEGRLPAEQDDARGVLARLSSELDEALAELQSISRGIHPGILSAGGLGPALRTLARRSPVEVELAVETEERFPEAVEVAGYFVASEALANATKHAKASVIRMSLAARNGTIVLSIRDDGVGGADLTQGTGLVGLTDRVEALGGSISVRSRPGEGTQITAELPLAPETAVPGVSA
jgi:signal transduction histidine kinase